MDNSKQKYRQESMRLRSQLTSTQWAKLSEQIYKNFVSYIKLQNFKSIHVYISYNNEPVTYEIIEYLLKKGYEVYVPYIRGEVMHTSRLEKMDFVDGKYSIPEPKIIDASPDDKQYDLIIVPTLAYDAANNRLGYGKGFYDSFLVGQKKAIKTGLCYSMNKVDNLPSEPHDIKLDQIITD